MDHFGCVEATEIVGSQAPHQPPATRLLGDLVLCTRRQQDLSTVAGRDDRSRAVHRWTDDGVTGLDVPNVDRDTETEAVGFDPVESMLDVACGRCCRRCVGEQHVDGCSAVCEHLTVVAVRRGFDSSGLGIDQRRAFIGRDPRKRPGVGDIGDHDGCSADARSSLEIEARVLLEDATLEVT